MRRTPRSRSALLTVGPKTLQRTRPLVIYTPPGDDSGREFRLGGGPEDFLHKPPIEFDAFLKEKGITHTSQETGGGHTWLNARHDLAETLPLFFK